MLTSQTTLTGASNRMLSLKDSDIARTQVLSSTGASQVQWIDVSAGYGALAGSET